MSCQSPTFAHLTLGPPSPSSLGPWDSRLCLADQAQPCGCQSFPPVWKCFQSSVPWGQADHRRLSCLFLQTEFPKGAGCLIPKFVLSSQHHPAQVPAEVTSLLDGDQCSWLGEREFWKQCDPPLLGACLPRRLFCFMHCRANSQSSRQV